MRVGSQAVRCWKRWERAREGQKFVFGRLTRQSWESRAGRGSERVPLKCARREPCAGTSGLWEAGDVTALGSGVGSSLRLIRALLGAGRLGGKGA